MFSPIVKGTLQKLRTFFQRPAASKERDQSTMLSPFVKGQFDFPQLENIIKNERPNSKIKIRREKLQTN